MMKRVCILLITFMLVVCAGCGSGNQAASKDVSETQAADQIIEIKIGHVGAPVSPQQGAADIFIDQIEKKTKGSIKLKIYNSSQLGDERELVEGLQMGTIDGGIISSGLFASTYNVMGAFEVPFLFKNAEHVLTVCNSDVGKQLMSKLEEKAGLKPVAIWDHGFRQVTNSVRPIKEPSDFKGLKIRSPEVPAYSLALEALEAMPVPMAFTELYIALDRKVVDGQHNPLMHVKGQRFWEVQKYLTVMDFAYTPNILAFSNKVWSKLSKDQQNQVQEAAAETARLWSAASAKEELTLLEEIKGKMEVLTAADIKRDDFVKIVVDKAYPKYKDKFGQEFVDFLNSVQKLAGN